METIAGLFSKFEDADRAVDALLRAGFEREAISVLARNQVVEQKIPQDRSAKDVAGGAGLGIAGGGALGGLVGLLVGLGAITIPGLGPAVAAGALASTLASIAGGAGVGAAVGGILGAMTSLAIPEEEAQIYAEGVKRGGILVVVQVQEAAQGDQARAILSSANAVDVEKLRAEYQQEGWNRFTEA